MQAGTASEVSGVVSYALLEISQTEWLKNLKNTMNEISLKREVLENIRNPYLKVRNVKKD